MGYQNKVGNAETSSMKRMMCSSFLQIGAKDSDGKLVEGMYLSQLKFDNYQNVEYFQEEGLTGFRVIVLDSEGAPLANYIWVDEYDDDAEEWSGGAWKHNESGKFIGQDGEPDYLLSNGNALWCYLPKKRTGSSGYTFCSAGEVLVDSQALPMNDTTASMKRGMGNPFCVPVNLSTVSFDGYQKVEYFQEEGLTGFRAIVLDSEGAPLANYIWVDEYDDDAEEWSGGAWKHNESGKFIGQDGEPDFQLQPGDGLWCYAPKIRTGAKLYTMKFPGMNASK